jgi:ATP-dependent Lon protease
MAVALVSALTGIPTRPDVAMTGEITLRGSVLPIGGLIEKAVATRRAGLKTVVIPMANEKDLDEIPEDVRADLEFIPIETMDQVLGVALQKPVVIAPTPPASPTPPPDDSQPAQYTH